MSISRRTFGVEIECGHDDLRDDEVADRMEAAGFKVGDYEAGKDYYGYTDDGSGIEIKTPILQGEKGYKEVFRIMDFLRDLGCFVTRADGMHVHIGAEQLVKDDRACAALARTWYNNQVLIGRMCSSHRTGHGACPRVVESELATLGQTEIIDHGWGPKTKYKNYGDRKSLNLQPLEDYGTVEFRLHEGCLDPVKAVAWIKFCQKLIDHSVREKETISCAKSKTALLTTLSVPHDAIAILAPRQKQLTRPAPRYGPW